MFMEKAVRTKRGYMKPESKVYPVPVEHLMPTSYGLSMAICKRVAFGLSDAQL